MKKVICYETDDGALYRRYRDAAAHERARRKAKQSAERWDFLFTCWWEPGDHKEGRLPPGAWYDAGEYLYVWSCHASLETAVRRAATRCQRLRALTQMDWRIDEDAHRNGSQDAKDIVFIRDHDLLRNADLVH